MYSYGIAYVFTAIIDYKYYVSDTTTAHARLVSDMVVIAKRMYEKADAPEGIEQDEKRKGESVHQD